MNNTVTGLTHAPTCRLSALATEKGMPLVARIFPQRPPPHPDAQVMLSEAHLPPGLLHRWLGEVRRKLPQRYHHLSCRWGGGTFANLLGRPTGLHTTAEIVPA